MDINKSIRWSIIAALVVLSLATPNAALAGAGCGSSYVVQPGDTLWSVANSCGISVEALMQANPGMGYNIYAGQTLWMPGANQYGSGYYGYQDGSNYYGYQDGGSYYGYHDGWYGQDCMADGTYNGGYNWGQYYGPPYGINCNSPYVPNYYGYQYGNSYYSPYNTSGGGTYVVQWGDTMRKIADRHGVSLSSLIAANPQIWNPNLIYRGQIINLPGSSYYYYPGQPYSQTGYGSSYTVQRGDTLRIIASRFGTTVHNLLALNPQIWNASLIYAGQVIRIW